MNAKAVAFKMLRELSSVELRVLLYMLDEVSVGEMLIFKELRLEHNIEYDDALRALKTLISKGYIEKDFGCFSLSKELRSRRVREQIQNILRSIK